MSTPLERSVGLSGSSARSSSRLRAGSRLIGDRVSDVSLTVGQVTAGQLLNGSLGSSNSTSPQRRKYYDDYRLVGTRAGQQVHLSLQSNDFYPLLELRNARTHKLIWNGSDELNLTNGNASDGITFRVKVGIPYLVRVTSLFEDETGQYHLKTQRFNPASSKNYSFFWGYGLVNAASAVARSVHLKQPFANVSPLHSIDWGLDAVKAPSVWTQGYTGQTVTVAVIDTGVDYTHPDLKQNIWRNPGEIPDNGIDDDHNGYIDDVHGWNFADHNANPTDTDGHGTHVAGIVAARKNGFGATGVAYNASIMPVRVFGRHDTTSEQLIAKGVNYAVENGAQVINLSLGGTGVIDPDLREALRRAKQAGVTVVIAAGNDRGSSGATQPLQPAFQAVRDLGIAVGAINRNHRVASYSNPAGNQRLPFVVAPGVDIYSTVPKTVYSSSTIAEPEGTYDFYSGTSMATPYVTGIVALMLSANPRLTPAQISRILTQTANLQAVRLEI